MGNRMHASVTLDGGPKQGSWLHRQVRVYFNGNLDRSLVGHIVRDDDEEPYEIIIRLRDGRLVLGSEVTFSPDNGSSGGA